MLTKSEAIECAKLLINKPGKIYCDYKRETFIDSSHVISVAILNSFDGNECILQVFLAGGQDIHIRSKIEEIHSPSQINNINFDEDVIL